MWKYFLFIYCFMKIYQFLTLEFFLLNTILHDLQLHDFLINMFIDNDL